MTDLVFYERANWVGKSERLTVTEAQARQRHSLKKPYGAVMTGLKEKVTIEFFFGDTFCEVVFQEPEGRPNLIYDFETRDDKLFLFEAVYLAYEGNGRSVARRETSMFEPSAKVRVIDAEPSPPFVYRGRPRPPSILVLPFQLRTRFKKKGGRGRPRYTKGFLPRRLLGQGVGCTQIGLPT